MRIRWRGLELPSCVVRDESVSSLKYGRFLIEPFERGFGTTVGNSLRRILLSSLEGAAVTSVRIARAEHEFSSLEGVLQDVTTIILNIKSLVIRHDGEGVRTMRLHADGRKGEMVEVRADQFECDPAIEVINKDQLVATLTANVPLDIELTVAKGRGYATADENRSGEQVIGVIPVDSVFSPVTRVRYRVEDTRVGQRTNYDRLVMEIWTKGTITPELALVEAAKILRKHLNPFVQWVDSGEAVATREDVVPTMIEPTIDEALEAKLSMPVSELDLSVRASNCLDSAKIATVRDLVQWTEPDLLKLRSFGKTSMREVKRKLADIGLALGMRLTSGGSPTGGDGSRSTDNVSV
ncbi:MAG: DNA-directed RNA polymerase subunit alpha [Phycisphaerae bacterium]|nr:DNA-directed RNA polymerase subunit alpha [Phycisphaerae bacterium]